MKKITICLGLMIISLVVIAHEFWLQPQQYHFKKDETATIKFKVGENFTGDNWVGNNSKINQLIHYTPSNKQIDIAALVSNNKGDSIQLKLTEEGTHMVIYNSKNSFINLTPAKFNPYLKEDGLDEVIAYRKLHNEENINGKEYYQRSVKTVLQVGTITTNETTQPTALPLDVIPDENIYNLGYQGKNPIVKFTVLFKRKPLVNKLIKLWHKTGNKKTELTDLRTNNLGKISAKIILSGSWMISCVHMERNTVDTTADWQSYWSSLTFGYPYTTGKGNSFIKKSQ